MKISVVTPSFNQAATLEATILSVLDQGHTPFEHIVMDGGSDDGSIDVLRRYPHLTWEAGPDDGQTDAINKGLDRATGDVVAYLNSDDIYLPGAFAKVAEAFADPTCMALVGDCDVIDPGGKKTGRYQARLERPEELVEYWRWNSGVCIPQPAVFLRREALTAVGLFDPSYDLAMDLEMWLRLGRRFDLRILNTPLAAYREAPDTKTSLRHSEMLLESCRAALDHIEIVPAERRAQARRRVRRVTAELLIEDAERLGLRGSAARTALWRAVRLWPAVLRAPLARKLLLA